MAIAFIGFLTVLLVLGVGIVLFPRGKESPVEQLTQGEKAFLEAQQGAAKGLSLLVGDSVKAQELCSGAWGALTRARDGGVLATTLAPVERDVTRCLDSLYAVKHPKAQLIYDTTEMTPQDLVQGPDRNAFFIDQDTKAVWRVTMRNGQGEPVVKQKDGRGGGIGIPRLMATGGADLVILDDAGNIWRWRRTDVPITLLRKPDQPVLGDDVIAMEAYVVDAGANLYNLYVVDPSSKQIVKYIPELGGSGFSDWNPYLASDNEDVANFKDLYVDKSLFTLSSDNMARHYGGRVYDYKLATPPDDDDMRPGHDYRFVAAWNSHFYVYDARWSRVLVFDGLSGDYLEQWQTTGRVPPMNDLRGMYIVEPSGNKKNAPATLVWLSPTGLYQSVLTDDPNAAPIETPAPGASAVPQTSPKPRKTPKG
jgi:hypothetical protein